MRLLLDTCAFLWFVTGDSRLSRRARRALEHTQAEVILSAVSVWEIAIKASLGRLSLPAPVDTYIGEKIASGFVLIPIEWTHAAAVERLPLHHRDPFDRLLIAQALSENLPIVTSDAGFSAYGVKVVW
jgi:PIN domain nuclease of toxin-antitoxin system